MDPAGREEPEPAPDVDLRDVVGWLTGTAQARDDDEEDEVPCADG